MSTRRTRLRDVAVQLGTKSSFDVRSASYSPRRGWGLSFGAPTSLNHHHQFFPTSSSFFPSSSSSTGNVHCPHSFLPTPADCDMNITLTSIVLFPHHIKRDKMLLALSKLWRSFSPWSPESKSTPRTIPIKTLPRVNSQSCYKVSVLDRTMMNFASN